MGIKIIDIVLLLLNVTCVLSEHILSCDGKTLDQCPGDRVCNTTSYVCDCLAGYMEKGDECVPPSSYTSSHDATAAVVSVLTIALVVCGLVLVIRKYSLVEYLRQRVNLRRNNDVMYEDVMIGQDDPPLSP